MLEQSSSEIPSSVWASMNSWFTPAVFFVLLNLMIGTIALTSTLAKKKPNPNPKSAAASGSVLQRLKSTNFYPYFNRSQDPHSSPIYKHAPDSETETHYFFQENSVQLPQDSSIYKLTPDSELGAGNLETETRYFFQENSIQVPQDSSIEKQTLFKSKNLETEARYFFQENLQASQARASNPVFEQAHELHPRESPTHFVTGHKDSILGDAEEEKAEEEHEPAQSMDEVFSRLTGGHVSRTKSDTEPASGESTDNLPKKMKKSASLKSPFGHFEEEKIVEARRPATVREKAKATDGDVEVDAKADDFINKFKQQLKLQRLDSIVRYKEMIGRGSGGGR